MVQIYLVFLFSRVATDLCLSTGLRFFPQSMVARCGAIMPLILKGCEALVRLLEDFTPFGSVSSQPELDDDRFISDASTAVLAFHLPQGAARCKIPVFMPMRRRFR